MSTSLSQVSHFARTEHEKQLMNKDPLMNPNAIQLSKTHGAMIRFPSADDEDFKKVAACLVSMVEGAVGKAGDLSKCAD